MPPTGLQSLDELLRHVEKKHVAQTDIIRQVNIDGVPVASMPDQGESPNSPEYLSRRNTIEIFTGTLNQILQDSIGEAQSYLERLESAIPSIATSFQISPGPEAFERLKQLFEGLYWMNLLNERLNAHFNIDPDTTSINGKSMRQIREKFASDLREMVSAQEREDFLLLADLLEYEITPLIPEWISIFSELAARMDSPR